MRRYLKIAVILISFLSFFFIQDKLYAQQSWTYLTAFAGGVSGFAINQNNELFASTLGGGVYRTSDGGNSWTQLTNGMEDRIIYSVHITSNGDIYIGTVSRGVFKSTNNGNFWFQTALIINVKVRAIVSDHNGNIYAGTHGRGIYKSSNGGETWSNINDPDKIYSMCTADNGYIFAGTSLPNGIYRSTDFGENYIKVQDGEQAFNSIVTRGENIYSITGNLETDNFASYKIVYSNDYGNTWITPYVFSNSSYGITLNQNNNLFVGKYWNIYKSVDGGYNYTTIQSGINQEAGKIISICCDSAGYIFLGQELGYVYKSNETTIGINPISNNIPSGFKLFQNYPNPFNPTTKIRFAIPGTPHNPPFAKGGKERGSWGFVKITIYNILGNEIAALLNESLKPGIYEIDFNASAYPSGIYFCRFSAGEHIEAIPMVFIK